MLRIAFIFFFFRGSAGAAADPGSAWIRPEGAGSPLIWGRRDGIVFGLPSKGGLPGPRGLVRVGIVDPATGKPILINFIAFEPVAAALPDPEKPGGKPRGGRKGFSELEQSALDGVRGKRLWVEGSEAGVLEKEGGIETLRVTVACEAFENGAQVSAEVRIRADRPEEAAIAISARAGSVPLAQATLTATMGNYGRMRRLWLKERIVSSLQVYEGYSGNDFIERDPYPLEALARSKDGAAWAALRSDEDDPASVPIPDQRTWQYRGPPLTQYWRVPREDVERDLQVRVNGRRVYWASRREIPGGVAFENFEFRQSYRPGQRFIFGLTRRQPEDLEPWSPPPARKDRSD